MEAITGPLRGEDILSIIHIYLTNHNRQAYLCWSHSSNNYTVCGRFSESHHGRHSLRSFTHSFIRWIPVYLYTALETAKSS